MENPNNTTGPFTQNLVRLLREMQAWYQGRGNHIASSPKDHSVGSALVRFADPCRSIGSIRLANALEAHQFLEKRCPPLMHLIAIVEGEYLGFLAQDESDSIIAGGITHLARDGKTVLRVKGQGENVFSCVNLHAMNSPLVTLSALMLGLGEEFRHRFPSHHAEIECFLDLRDELTLQTYAAVRREARISTQPIMVCHALEAIHRLTTTKKLAACLTPVDLFEARVAAYLLSHEAELAMQPLAAHILTTEAEFFPWLETIDISKVRRKGDFTPSRILIASTSPQAVYRLSETIKRNRNKIFARMHPSQE